MATTVYNVEEVLLIDGTKLTLRPNSIATQRKFMKTFNVPLDVGDEDTTFDKTYDRMMELTKICVTGLDKELGARDDLEEVFDEQTIYKIIEICGGIEINNPKLQAAMEAMAAEDGTN